MKTAQQRRPSQEARNARAAQAEQKREQVPAEQQQEGQ
jgi:hypothetical protein